MKDLIREIGNDDFKAGWDAYMAFEPPPKYPKINKNVHSPEGDQWIGWMIARMQDVNHIHKLHKLAGTADIVADNALAELDKSHGLDPDKTWRKGRSYDKDGNVI